MSKVTWSTSCKEDWKLSRREWDGIVPPEISNTSIETGVEIVPIVPSFDIVLVNWKASFCWVDTLRTQHTHCAPIMSQYLPLARGLSSILLGVYWKQIQDINIIYFLFHGPLYLQVFLLCRSRHVWISKGFKECFALTHLWRKSWPSNRPQSGMVSTCVWRCGRRACLRRAGSRRRSCGAEPRSSSCARTSRWRSRGRTCPWTHPSRRLLHHLYIK